MWPCFARNVRDVLARVRDTIDQIEELLCAVEPAGYLFTESQRAARAAGDRAIEHDQPSVLPGLSPAEVRSNPFEGRGRADPAGFESRFLHRTLGADRH